MSFFNFNDSQSLGEVRGVDTSKIFVRIFSAEKLVKTRVGHLVAIQGQDANEWLIGMVQKVWRDPIDKFITDGDEDEDQILNEENAAQVTLLGTYLAKYGLKDNYFTRAVLSLPDINRLVFSLDGESLENFMNILAHVGKEESKKPLEIGRYSLDRKAKAYLDGDKLFQRHAALLGSTGSGKSWSVANILEQASNLPNANIVLFDLHGEYVDLPYAEQLKIASPGDLQKADENILFLPFWLMNFDEIQSIIIDNKEQSAPNQSMAVLETIVELKRATLEAIGEKAIEESFTVNSPIPYKMDDLIGLLRNKNEEEIDTGEIYVSGEKKGQPKTKQGPLFDKLTRLLIRLNNKVEDRRYGFMFKSPDRWNKYETLHELARKLMGHQKTEGYEKTGIKVIDFSEVPSDVLPVMISLVARLIYQIQFWSDPGKENTGRHPILLVCDEAHLYLPSDPENIIERKSLDIFERIAKEGRKYGVGMLVVSQRPSDVSTTILSQCNNIISLRLTNERDKSVVKNLLPDTLGGILEVLPGLEIGEAVIVGDATLLPTRIILNKPNHRPKSATIDFWQRWQSDDTEIDLIKAVENFRKQSRNH
ncbi:ATP-binding protein [Neobacillus vireti]|uniref:ATP-binding protein n=1 Tax=Neobacillus vireti TaxID=220686 RepID=UPI002FFED878